MRRRSGSWRWTSTKPGREHVTEIVPAREGDARRGQHPQRPAHLPVPGRRAEPRSTCSTSPASRSAKSKLPGNGTVDGFGGDQNDTETFFVFTSYNTPTSVYRYDVLGDKTQLIRQPNVKFDPEKFAVEQVFYNSKDGTRVPMMLAYRKDLHDGRAAADAALRLRRLQHFADAGVSSPSTSPGWKWAACWRWPTCAAAASTARNGTWPARRSRSRTCSTISSPRPSG